MDTAQEGILDSVARKKGVPGLDSVPLKKGAPVDVARKKGDPVNRSVARKKGDPAALDSVSRKKGDPALDSVTQKNGVPALDSVVRKKSFPVKVAQKKGDGMKDMAQEVLDSAKELKSLRSGKRVMGKKLLKKELWDVSSRYHSMSIKDIHASDERFSAYQLKNFTTNFRSLKKKVDELRVQVHFDNLAVSQHKKMYP